MNDVQVIRDDSKRGETVWSEVVLRRLSGVEMQIWNGSMVVTEVVVRYDERLEEKKVREKKKKTIIVNGLL